MRTLSTDEAVQATGASPRQIRYWVTGGVIAPAVASNGPGTYLRFDEVDIAQIRACRVLSSLLNPTILRRALYPVAELIERSWPDLPARVAIDEWGGVSVDLTGSAAVVLRLRAVCWGASCPGT